MAALCWKHRMRAMTLSEATMGVWILGSIFFGGLNQKSAMISMCKIHIFIDSERFRVFLRKEWQILV